MSKFIFPPLIQQLRAANAGVIAFVDAGSISIGVTPVAFSAQFVAFSVNFLSTDSLEASILADSGSHAIGVPSFFTEVFSQFERAISFSLTSALEALTSTPAESMAVGVATFTSVS